MLKQIHRHQKFTILILILLASTMLLFGVDFGNGRESYALKINDQEISYNEYAQEKEQYTSQLKQQYGEAYQYILNNPNFSIDDKLKERIIPQTLINQKARKDKLGISDEVLQKKIVELFKNNNYENFLKYSGKSAKGFEEELRNDLTQELFSDFVRTMSTSSEAEARKLWLKDKQEYTIKYTKIGLEELKNKIKTPTKEDLQRIYEEQASTFETEKKLKYEYVAIGKNEAKNLVEVLPEDIELYYAENQNRFRSPKTAKANVLELKLKVEEGPETFTKIKESAEEILGEALAGTDFKELKNKKSEYFTISLTNNKSFNQSEDKGEASKQIFSLSEPGLTKLTKDGNSYKIIDVKKIVEGTLKPLEEVKEEITNLIKDREALSYSSIYGEDLYNEWLESKKEFSDFAKEKSLNISKTDLLSFSNSPSNLNGLSNQIALNIDDKKQIIELNSTTVLVNILEFKDSEIPTFEAVEEKLKDIFKKEQLEKLLADTEAELNLDLKEQKTTLLSLSKKYNLEVISKDKVSKLSGIPSEIVSPEISEAVFSTRNTPKLLNKVFRKGDSLIIAKVEEINEPKEKLFKADKKRYLEKSGNDNSELILATLVKKLKSNSEIDIRN